ncbi:MAG: transglutaminase-like domain-containing protein [Phycisphaerales bacterium]
MKAQRAIAVIMILGSSLLIAWVSGDIAFPAILCMLGMLGVQGRFKWDLRPERHYVTALLLLLLAALFSIHCEYAHPPSEKVAAFAWQTIARYFFASMILVLFLRSRQRPGGSDGETRMSEPGAVPLSPSLGLFHLASAMAGGQVLLLDDRYVAFRLVELASVTLVVFYAVCSTHAAGSLVSDKSPRRIGGSILRFALLIAAVNFGWIGGSVLYARVGSLNLLPNWLWRNNVSFDSAVAGISRIGFSTSGRLSNVLTIMEDLNAEPVLKITSDACPGYLRAVAFHTYSQSEWIDQSHWEGIYGEQSHLLGRMNVYRLSNRAANREMTIRHANIVIDGMFTPLGVCSVETPLAMLERDDEDGSIRPAGNHANLTYRVAYTNSLSGDPPSADTMRRMLGKPRQLDPRVRQLAAKVFRGCSTTAQKIDAVTRYFQTNYAYSLGLEAPVGEDRLTYFLLDASSGYCEYFASGAALLLRLVDVPTRYVTGFLVTERGEDDKSWVARNMDAHAWVEAWDRENNTWAIVEATAKEDLEDNALVNPSLDREGGGGLLLARLIQAVYDYGLLGVLGWFFNVYSLQTAVTVSLAFLGAAVSLALLRRYRRLHGAKSAKAVRSPEVLALHKMLAAMDRKVKSAGARRQPHETLHAFADRLRGCGDGQAQGAGTEPCAFGPRPTVSFPDWYLQYAGLRYCGAITPDRLRDLHLFARNLRQKS